MMDCHEFRRCLDEFADGTPGVVDESARVAHVETCAGCRMLVDDTLAVGTAVRTALGADTAPQSVRTRVRRVLANEAERMVSAGQADKEVGDRPRAAPVPAAPEAARSTLRRYSLILIPLAAAAVIVLSVGAWYALGPPPDATTTVVDVQNPVLEAARARHRWCSREEHVFHRDDDLPDDLAGIGATLGDELGLDVLSPSLVDQGFSFVGARRCRVAGVPVAHLLYFASREAVMLSLFSMYRVHDLEEGPGEGSRRYFSLTESSSRILAWNEGRQTYVLCASLGPDGLLPIGESLRGSSGVAGLLRYPSVVAMVGPPDSGIAAAPLRMSDEVR